MPFPGRPRKPDALKVLDGTWSASRDGNLEDVVLPVGVPAKPDALPPRAAAFWDEIVPQLIETGCVAEIDGIMLAELAGWYGRYRQWAEPLDAGELDDVDSRRRLLGACAAWKQFEQLAAKFGLNPVDRSRLRVTPKKESKLPRRRPR